MVPVTPENEVADTKSPIKLQNKIKLDASNENKPVANKVTSSSHKQLKHIDLNDQENLFESFMSQSDNPAPNKKLKKNVKNVREEKLLAVKEETLLVCGTVSMSPTKPTYTKKQGLIYTKLKPENVIVKTESQAKCEPFQTSQLKVKFEKLIRLTENSSDFDVDSQASTAGKRNFKKFRKVPKKSAQERHSQQTGKFKAVKTEAFDINSQFDSFINSMR